MNRVLTKSAVLINAGIALKIIWYTVSNIARTVRQIIKDYPNPAQTVIPLDNFLTGIFLDYACSQVLYNKGVKFHQYRFIYKLRFIRKFQLTFLYKIF